MLYTFAQSSYMENIFTDYLQQAQKHDAIVLWQDGVYLLLKYPHAFLHLHAPCYVLTLDLEARNLTHLLHRQPNVIPVSLAELVGLTAMHYPQFAL